MKKLVEPYGKTFTWEIKLQMMGMKEREAGRILIGIQRWHGSFNVHRE